MKTIVFTIKNLFKCLLLDSSDFYLLKIILKRKAWLCLINTPALVLNLVSDKTKSADLYQIYQLTYTKLIS